MGEDDAAAALQRLRARAKARQRALDGEEEDIVAALHLGLRKSEIVKAVDRSREHVDRIARRHNIPSRYPARSSAAHDATVEPRADQDQIRP